MVGVAVTHVGHELIGAGMLILAEAVAASRWTMTNWSAGHASAMSGGCGHARANGEYLNLARPSYVNTHDVTYLLF